MNIRVMHGIYKTKNYEIAYSRTNRSRQPIFLIQPFPGSEVVYKPLVSELLKVNSKADFINFTLPGLDGRNNDVAIPPVGWKVDWCGRMRV